MTPVAVAARRYARHGWPVFPVNGKAPVAGTRGYLDATCDVQRVADWWTRHPAAGIGLWPAGAGLCVFDVDGPRGERAATALGLLSEPTLVCRTARGSHRYYRTDVAAPPRRLAPELDVRGHGHVVVPPSRHPDGTRYRWERAPIAPLPPKARAALLEAGATFTARARHWTHELGRVIPEGQRNVTLTRLVGGFLARGLTASEVMAVAHGLNAAYCRPPLDTGEVGQLVYSVARRHYREEAV